MASLCQASKERNISNKKKFNKCICLGETETVCFCANCLQWSMLGIKKATSTTF